MDGPGQDLEQSLTLFCPVMGVLSCIFFNFEKLVMNLRALLRKNMSSLCMEIIRERPHWFRDRYKFVLQINRLRQC